MVLVSPSLGWRTIPIPLHSHIQLKRLSIVLYAGLFQTQISSKIVGKLGQLIRAAEPEGSTPLIRGPPLDVILNQYHQPPTDVIFKLLDLPSGRFQTDFHQKIIHTFLLSITDMSTYLKFINFTTLPTLR
jgi:hypothetical protein